MQLKRPLLNDDGKSLPFWCAKACQHQQKKEHIFAHHQGHLQLQSQKKKDEERAFFYVSFSKKRADPRCARENKVVVLFIYSLSLFVSLSRAEFKMVMARFCCV
jgi:hypothetical protein